MKVSLAMMAIIGCYLVSGSSGQESAQVRPLVGAIRWDAWHGDQGAPGRAVRNSLEPGEWHYRLPFFARVLGEGQVSVDGSAQEVMDKEIEYASHAGLDYWAFVTYPPENPMSIGLARYLASERRNKIKFCLITECGRWADREYVRRLSDLMAEPGYLTVLAGRPVLYLGFIKDDELKKRFGDAKSFRGVVDNLRSEAQRKGTGNPYIVIMDFNPEQGKKWLDTLGCDAISSYATEGGGKGLPYSDLVKHTEQFWERCKATGAQVVPIIMSGWDRRPRVARPVPWETWQKPGAGIDKYYQAPTPGQLAAHLGGAVDWVKANPSHSQAALTIIYAWNENDEGGWLIPTVSEGTARLDALSNVLRPEGKSGKPPGPGEKQ